MQCFFLAVVEEGIILYVVLQCGLKQQVGMKHQQAAFSGQCILLIHAKDFAGLEENHCRVGIIIVSTSAT